MAGYLIPFAAAETFERQVKAARNGMPSVSNEVLLLVGIGIAIGVVLFVAVYIRHWRKQNKGHQSNRVSISSSKSNKPVESDVDDREGEEANSERRRVRKRRRRRDHRPRNPTLDKTGGLPPLRSDDELPKF